jgi:transposase-like protein
MNYSCPVCNSTAVDEAGGTDMYQSLICRECGSWSTVPLPGKRRAPPLPRPPRRP